MNEPKINLIMKVEASSNPPKLLQPRKQPLDFPAALVTAQRSAVLRRGFLPVRFVRRDHLNALLPQLLVERIRVISFITN